MVVIVSSAMGVLSLASIGSVDIAISGRPVAFDRNQGPTAEAEVRRKEPVAEFLQTQVPLMDSWTMGKLP